MITENTSLDELFTEAKKTTMEVLPGEEFIVKELFRGFEWNRIPRGIRTKLGAMYFIYAKGEGSEGIVPLDKTAQNQQKYKKL